MSPCFTWADVSDYAEIGKPVTRLYGIEESKGTAQNWTITQTENGLIYLGHNNGISEWDGERWKLYVTPLKTRIRSLTQWRDKKIYVGTVNDIGYFEADEFGVLAYHSLLRDWSSDKKQFGEVWSVVKTSWGVGFVTDHSVLVWDGKKVHELLSDTDQRIRVDALSVVDDIFLFKRIGFPNIFRIASFLAIDDPTDTAQTLHVPELTSTKYFLPANIRLKRIFKKNNQLFAFTGKSGVYQLSDAQPKLIVDAKVFGESTNIFKIIASQDGFYYAISMENGLFILNKQLKVVKHYRGKNEISIDALYGLFEDNQGNIWLSGRGDVVKMIPPHIYSQYDSDTNSQGSENVANILGRPGVSGQGVLRLTNSKRELGPAYFENLKPNKNFSWHHIVYANHLLYSEDEGVFAVPIIEYDETTGDMKTGNEAIHILSVDSGRMFAIDEASSDLFVVTYEGLYRIRYVENQWTVNLIPDTKDRLDRIAIDDNGDIWMGTATQSVYRVQNASASNKIPTVEKFDANDGVPPNNMTPFRLSRGIVFGSDNGWLEYQENGTLQFSAPIGLPEKFSTQNSALYRLYEEKPGRYWYQVKGDKGLLSQDVVGNWQDNPTMFTPFPDISYIGFSNASLTEHATSNGVLWFGLGTGHIYRLNYEQLLVAPKKGQLQIREISDLTDDTILFGGWGTAALPELNQDKNSFRIQFALSDNTLDKKNVYRTRLLGSSNEKWSKWSTESSKDFTQLQGAKYSFELQAKDGWGRVFEEQLIFRILPPWYLSTWAWAAYVLLAFILLVLSGWTTQRWRTRKLIADNLALEQLVNERTAEVQAKVAQLKSQQELKDRFFSNVSHEFRTPLTLIIEPLKTLIENENDSPTSKQHLTKTALNNAKKMLSLVGQVLDVNRLEEGKLSLRISQYDIAETIRDLAERFTPWAEQHRQIITCENCNDPLLLWVDIEQIEKCISNLLSNAIKYSGRNTHITISLHDQGDQVSLQVKDTGKGILDEDHDRVFERFYQAKSSEQLSSPGTGIGLALVKELIELHSGTINLSSQLNKGSVFTILLLKDKQHFAPDLLIEPISVTNSSPLMEAENKHDINQNEDEQTTLLIVDDNAELRHFISLRLSSSYRILQAVNGELGYAAACGSLPDLIISDVMMPVMTGLEMLSKLKQNKDTANIPVILLTAKATKRETVEGFGHGADDYLTKPFDTSELVVRVNSLIYSRKLIRQRVAFEHSTQALTLEQNNSFSDKLIKHIEAHLNQPDFDVEQLASLMYVSRETLTRKCKKQLGLSPSLFINQIRMHHASVLLQQQKLSVSEIAYALGFESLAYFSRSFKKHTGKSPSQFTN